MDQIKAIALWDYTASDESEISFAAGDVILVVELHNEDWYEGINASKQGFFPGNHVKLVANGSLHIPAISKPDAASHVVNLAIAAQPLILEPSPVSKTLATPPISVSGRESSSGTHKGPLITDTSFEKDDSSSEEDEDSPLPPGWCIVSTSDNMTYYWNESTQETSWTFPTSNGKKSNADIYSATIKIPATPLNPSANRIENVSQELIRREGALSYKIKKEFGGIEPRKGHSWHKTWGVVCVGYLVLYKEEPAKKKNSCLPVQVINLESITIKKEISKKCFISLESKSGAVYYLRSDNESELNNWISSITDSTRENSSDIEYDNVISKLFVNPKNDMHPKKQDSVVGSNPPPPKSIEKTSKKAAANSMLTVDIQEVESSEDISTKSSVKNMLNSFFFKRGAESLEKKVREKAKEIPLEATVFGGTLENLAGYSKSNVPLLVKNSIQYVESSGGLESQGIYRLSGNASVIQKFRAQINQNNDQDLYVDTMDVNVIAALLKLFFRELQVPVIPFEMYHQFIDASKMSDYNSKLIEIKNLVQALPKVHYDVLEFLMRHLVQVAARSEVNKMEPSNLAIVFGPSLLRIEEKGEADMQQQIANMLNMSSQNSLIENMITQTNWLFDGNPN